MVGCVWSRGRIPLGPWNQLLERTQVRTSYLRDPSRGRVCRSGICLSALSLIADKNRLRPFVLCTLREGHICLHSARKGPALLCAGTLGFCVEPPCLHLEPGNHCCLAVAGWDRSHLCVWFGLVGWEGLLPGVPKSPGFTFPEEVEGGVVSCIFKSIPPLCESTDKLSRFALEACGFTRKSHHALLLQLSLNSTNLLQDRTRVLSSKGGVNMQVLFVNKYCAKQNEFLVIHQTLNNFREKILRIFDPSSSRQTEIYVSID